MKEIDTLVKMANQIAANFSFHEDGAERLADHLLRFWAPVMTRQLREFAAAGGEGLDDMVVRVIQSLPDQ